MKNCAACFKTITQSGKCSHCGYDPEQRINSMGLPVGTILFHGQYQVGKVLGKPGGFGITYLALDINLNTLVAIKEFFPRHIVGRDTDKISLSPYTQEDQHIFNLSLVEFVREARILAQLSHPNIVRVRSYFEENSTAYIVMDYLEGQTLDGLYATANGTCQANLSSVTIITLSIPLCSITEQKVVSSKLESLSTETQRLESIYQQKIAVLDELKQSQLQRAFAGEL